MLAGVKGARFAPTPLRGADALDADSAHALKTWPLDDDARSDAPVRGAARTVFGAKERSYRMPVRYGLRS